VASTPTAWRALDKVSEGTCRCCERPSPGPGCCLGGWCGTRSLTELVLDFDATVVIAHSEKQDAPQPGSTPMAFTLSTASWTAPTSLRRSLAGLLRPATPAPTPPPTTSPCSTWRCRACPRGPPGAEGHLKLLARADSAGATHEFAAACRQRGVAFSFGFPVTEVVRLPLPLSRGHLGAGRRSRRRGKRRRLPGRANSDARPFGLARRFACHRALRTPAPRRRADALRGQDGWRYTAFITDTARL